MVLNQVCFSVPLMPRESDTSLVVRPWLDTQCVIWLLVPELHVGCWILLWPVEHRGKEVSSLELQISTSDRAKQR